MQATDLKCLDWIKSPLLYQLSYRPKLLRLLEKVVPAALLKTFDVPPVYPITASGRNRIVGPWLPAVTSGRAR